MRRTRIADVAIIHSKTSLSVIAERRYIYHLRLFCGRGTPRPYKALREQGYKHYFTAITEALRLSWKFEVGHFLLPTRVR